MRISSITKNAGKACNNRLYRHIRTFEKIVKNYFVIYRKYYKEILDAISEENCFPDSCSGGGVYLREAILKKVPEITEEQLRMIWRELPFVIEKRTQDWIEREKQFSENYIRKAKKRKPGKTKRTADQIGK